MSKSTRRKSHASHRRGRPSDLGPYVGFILIWIFASFIIYLSTPEFGPVFSTGLVAAFLIYVATCTWQVALGSEPGRIGAGLVRLPFMLVGERNTRVHDLVGEPKARAGALIATVVAVIAVAATIAMVLMQGA